MDASVLGSLVFKEAPMNCCGLWLNQMYDYNDPVEEEDSGKKLAYFHKIGLAWWKVFNIEDKIKTMITDPPPTSSNKSS